MVVEVTVLFGVSVRSQGGCLSEQGRYSAVHPPRDVMTVPRNGKGQYCSTLRDDVIPALLYSLLYTCSRRRVYGVMGWAVQMPYVALCIR